MRWVKDDNPQSAINNKPELIANGKTAAQNRWIAYNKNKGQYSSAMEHAVPEQSWVDKSQCRYTDDEGVIQNPSKINCAQGISAVKAIAIAQEEGQRIYTINQKNRDTALPKLTIGGAVGAEIRSAIQAGKEVTFHESPITAHGWTGYGYVMTDPDTGAGGYIIEGGGNGGWLGGAGAGVAIGASLSIIFLSLLLPTGMAIAAGIMLGLIILMYAIAALALVISTLDGDEDAVQCAIGGAIYGIGIGSIIPHLLMVIFDSFVEFSVDSKGAKDCGL